MRWATKIITRRKPQQPATANPIWHLYRPHGGIKPPEFRIIIIIKMEKPYVRK